MLLYALKRLLHVIPVTIGVSIVCFMLIHIAPRRSARRHPAFGRLVGDAGADAQLLRPRPAVAGTICALGLARPARRPRHIDRQSVARYLSEILGASVNSIILAVAAAFIGFMAGSGLGFLAGVFRGTWMDRIASGMSMLGVSVPHYWLGMVLVIAFSVTLGWLPAMGGGPEGSSGRSLSWAYLQFLILPAVTMSVIPMGIIARTIRSLVADILSQDFTQALAAKGLMNQADPAACRAQRGADRAFRHGPAARLSSRRLDPDRDRFLLARNRLSAERRDLHPRPADPAGHDPRARDVLRLPEPRGRRAAERYRSAHPEELTMAVFHPARYPPAVQQSVVKSPGFWSGVSARLCRDPVAMISAWPS